MAQHPFKTYSLELLHYSLITARGPERARQAGAGAGAGEFGEPGATAKALKRMTTLLEKSGKRELLLLGYGTGALADALACAQCDGFFAGARATVLSLEPVSVQARLPGWWTDNGPCQVLTDSSPWALALLLAAFGPSVKDVLMLLNPELPKGKERTGLAALQRTLLAAEFFPLESARKRDTLPAPRLSVAAVLHPEEPGLEHFFAQIPAWVAELCVVWDADEVVDHPALEMLNDTVAVRAAAHPLNLDFAAQRNRMLALCSGEWVLYLDGDEQLSPSVWNALPGVMTGQGLAHGVRNPDFWFLPRRNLDSTGERFHIGYGLWPDLQLRLFRRRSGIAFHRPVHEELTGVTGPGGILVNGPIDHYSRVRKSAEEIERKLDLFSRASGAPGTTGDSGAASQMDATRVHGPVIHRLNPAHPSLPLGSLPALEPSMDATTLRLLLPVNPARG